MLIAGALCVVQPLYVGALQIVYPLHYPKKLSAQSSVFAISLPILSATSFSEDSLSRSILICIVSSSALTQYTASSFMCRSLHSTDRPLTITVYVPTVGTRSIFLQLPRHRISCNNDSNHTFAIGQSPARYE